MRRRLALVLAPVLALSALALAGCSFSANLTVPASQVADTAETALESSIGFRPEVDCGAGQVDLVEGTEVACTATDPSSGTEYDATSTITNVDGTEYEVHVQVADTPNN